MTDYKSSSLIGVDRNPIREINGFFFNEKFDKER